MPESKKTDWDHIRPVNGVIDFREFGGVAEEEPSQRGRPTGEDESSTQSPKPACRSRDS